MTAVEVVKNFFLGEEHSDVTPAVNECVNKLMGEALHYEVRPGQHQASEARGFTHAFFYCSYSALFYDVVVKQYVLACWLSWAASA